MNIVLWVLQVFLGGMFLFAGIQKAFRPLDAIAKMMTWVPHVPPPLVRFIGVAELLGGIGLIAPPVGLNVYIVNGLAKGVPIAESYRGVVPFLISDFIRTIILLFVPSLSLFLLRFMD